MTPRVGDTLGAFRIVEELDSGGMGVVYRARDERLGWDVALKVLAPGLLGDETSRKRLEVEARALASVEHPAVAGFHGLGHEDGLDFLIMEFIAGEPMSRRIQRGALPEAELIDLGTQLADGLAAAHGKGVIHRDLKPANLMLTPEGRLRILDFGLAKLTTVVPETALTVEDSVPGTLPYLAPELLNGSPADARTDVYAAGLVLYEAATGATPFPGLRGPALWDAIVNAAAQPPRARNPRLSRGLDALIMRCLDKRPDVRPDSAVALAAQLRALARPAGAGRERRVAAVTLGLLGLTAVGYYLLRDRPMPVLDDQLHSWAVLPLSGETSDSDHAYFAEGMAAELVGQLSSMPSIRVISHESTRRYGASPLPIRRIARELGAQGLVTGDLRFDKDRVRISMHLVDGRNDSELWSKTFEGNVNDFLSVQNRVERAVVRQVNHYSGRRGRAQVASHDPTETAAYDDYLRARYHWNRRPSELYRAIEYFERAIHADSLYALAHAGLADAWAAVGLYGLRPPLETRRMARAAARRAVMLDENLSTAHGSLAHILHNYEWDWEGAETEYRRAIALNPNDAGAHHGLAHLLAQIGRHDEAKREIRTAVALNPRALPSLLAVAVFDYYTGDYAAALDTLRHVAELDSGNVLRLRLSAGVLDRLGRRDEAMAALARSVELQGQPALAEGLRRTYATHGFDAALELMVGALVQKRASGAYEPAEHVAELYARLGRVEEAFQWLEIAFREHDTELNRLKVDPLFEPLRRDPRFADLMRRVGFPEANS